MPGRNQQPIQPEKGTKLGLPPRMFLYTQDQLATILEVDVRTLAAHYVHYEGRSIGVATRDQMVARNIAPADMTPEWRVAEQELIRFMKRKGFRYYDRGFLGY
jgi:hypothetical protein